jgi:hypothetical protein
MIERHAIPLLSAIRPSLASNSEVREGDEFKVTCNPARSILFGHLIGGLVTLGWSWVEASQSKFFFFGWGGGWAFLFALFAHGRLETKLRRVIFFLNMF